MNYVASVFLNGEKLGDHEGGFTAFNFEATSLLKEGDNFLIVEVSNTRRADAVPALKFDWWNYGGITRDVTLVEVPTTFIQDYSVQLTRGSTQRDCRVGAIEWAQDSEEIAIGDSGSRDRVRNTDEPRRRCAIRVRRQRIRFGTKREKRSEATEVVVTGDPKLYDRVVTRARETRPRTRLDSGRLRCRAQIFC